MKGEFSGIPVTERFGCMFCSKDFPTPEAETEHRKTCFVYVDSERPMVSLLNFIRNDISDEVRYGKNRPIFNISA